MKNNGMYLMKRKKDLFTSMSYGDFKKAEDFLAARKLSSDPAAPYFRLLVDILTEIPHRSELSHFSIYFKQPLFSNIEALLGLGRCREFSDFEFDDGSSISTELLAYAEIRGKKSEDAFVYHITNAFNPRRSHKVGVNKRALHTMAKEVKKYKQRLIKANGLIRASHGPRNNVHLALGKIKKAVQGLEELITRPIEKSKNKVDLCVDDGFPSLLSAKGRYEVIRDIINWRVALDLTSSNGSKMNFEGFTSHDIKMMVVR